MVQYHPDAIGSRTRVSDSMAHAHAELAQLFFAACGETREAPNMAVLAKYIAAARQHLDIEERLLTLFLPPAKRQSPFMLTMREQHDQIRRQLDLIEALSLENPGEQGSNVRRHLVLMDVQLTYYVFWEEKILFPWYEKQVPEAPFWHRRTRLGGIPSRPY